MILLQAADTAQQATGAGNSLWKTVLDFGIDNILAIIAITLSVVAMIYSNRTKRFDVGTEHRKEVLEWHAETVKILLLLKFKAKDKDLSTEERATHLSELSALIENGRFIFPNKDEDDNWGNEKPHAYRGYRHLVLDCLVFYYFLFNRDDYGDHLEKAEQLHRYFTSFVFHRLDPKKYLKKLNKYYKTNDYALEKNRFNDQQFFINYIKYGPDFFDKYVKREKKYDGKGFDEA